MRNRFTRLALAGLTSVALVSATAATSAMADPAATLTVTAPATASTGSDLPINLVGAFAQTGSDSQTVSLFVVPPAAGTCPAGEAPPATADVVVVDLPVDPVVVLNASSDALYVPGTWTVCAYLGDQGTVVAAASQAVAVSGPPTPKDPASSGQFSGAAARSQTSQAPTASASKQSAKKAKHKKHKKHKARPKSRRKHTVARRTSKTTAAPASRTANAKPATTKI